MSYTDEEARKFEQDGEYRPYRKSVTYEVDYDPNMTVDKAYEYLKTLDVFSDAEDI